MIRFVLDEHLRGHFLNYIQRHNARSANPLDVVQVGDPDDLPLGTHDPELLEWCDRAGRILVSLDRSTLLTHLDERLRAEEHSPGIFFLRARPMIETVEFLECVAYASEPAEWENRVTYIP